MQKVVRILQTVLYAFLMATGSLATAQEYKTGTLDVETDSLAYFDTANREVVGRAGSVSEYNLYVIEIINV